MNNARYILLLLFALLLTGSANAQISVYRDSSEFDNAHARLRDVDFEDVYSVTLQRITIRNPWGLTSMGMPDSNESPTSDVFLWLGQGATLDFPTRTRTVVVQGYANPFVAEVTGFDDTVFQVSQADFPVEIQYEAGIRQIRFIGYDQYGEPDINWNAGLLEMLALDPDGDTLAFTDFDELKGDQYYLLGMELDAYDPQADSVLLEPIDVHGVTIHEPTIAFGGTFLSEFEARPDPDNPIGNLSVELSTDGLLEFPEGTEGVLMTLELIHEQDSFLIEVTDYAGVIDTVLETGYGREYDTTWVEDQRSTFAHLGFGSKAGIYQIRLLGGNIYSSIIVSALHLAEIPQTEISAVVRAVSDLDSSGFLKRGESEMLQGKLEEAIGKVEMNDRAGAVELLHSFRNDVQGLAGNDVLVPEETEFFMGDAAYIISRLGGVAGVENGDHAKTGANIALDIPVLLPDAVQIGYRATGEGVPTLRIHDLRGNELRTLTPEAAGDRMATTTWDLRDASGNRVPSGVYLITLEAGGEQVTRKIQVTR